MNKTEVSGYDVQRFSVLELEGDVHLVPTKLISKFPSQQIAVQR